jgi:hypothetical protein
MRLIVVSQVNMTMNYIMMSAPSLGPPLATETHCKVRQTMHRGFIDHFHRKGHHEKRETPSCTSETSPLSCIPEN